MKTRALLTAFALLACSVASGFSFTFVFTSPGLTISIGSNPPASVPTATKPPVITSQPVSISTPVGHNVVFVVAVTGPGPLSYRWKKNGVDLLNNSRTTGVYSPALRISNLHKSDAGNYRVVISNSAGRVESNVATLTVL